MASPHRLVVHQTDQWYNSLSGHKDLTIWEIGACAWSV